MDRLTLAVISVQHPLACVIDKDGDQWCAECLIDHIARRPEAAQQAWFEGARLAGNSPDNIICFWCHAVAEVYRGDEPA